MRSQQHAQKAGVRTVLGMRHVLCDCRPAAAPTVLLRGVHTRAPSGRDQPPIATPSQTMCRNLPQTGLAGPLRTHGSASAEDNVITLHLTSAVAALC